MIGVRLWERSPWHPGLAYAAAMVTALAVAAGCSGDSGPPPERDRTPAPSSTVPRSSATATVVPDTDTPTPARSIAPTASPTPRCFCGVSPTPPHEPLLCINSRPVHCEDRPGTTLCKRCPAGLIPVCDRPDRTFRCRPLNPTPPFPLCTQDYDDPSCPDQDYLWTCDDRSPLCCREGSVVIPPLCRPLGDPTPTPRPTCACTQDHPRCGEDFSALRSCDDGSEACCHGCGPITFCSTDDPAPLF